MKNDDQKLTTTLARHRASRWNLDGDGVASEAGGNIALQAGSGSLPLFEDASGWLGLLPMAKKAFSHFRFRRLFLVLPLSTPYPVLRRPFLPWCLLEACLV
jgi:hypothetical protein